MNNKESLSKAAQGAEPSEKVKDLAGAAKPDPRILKEGHVTISKTVFDNGDTKYSISGSQNITLVEGVGMMEFAKSCYLNKLTGDKA